MKDAAEMQNASKSNASVQKRLSEVRGRTAVRVLDIPETEEATRLKALGVCVGREVDMVKPGDPLIVHVVGSHVGISARLAAQVIVESL